MTARDRRAGMTLVEILVAVTLLGLLAAGMTTALHTGAGAWSQVRARLTLDRKIASANALLYAQLSAAAPVTAQPPPGVPAAEAPFFHGEPTQMRFVSSYSMTEGVRGGLKIVELSVGRASQGLRLLLTESPYRGPLSIGSYISGMDSSGPRRRLLFRPVQPRADSLIVADQLGECSFEYLREGRADQEPSEWVGTYDDLEQLPAAIRIRLAPAQAEPRLQPETVVVQVRSRHAPPDNGIRGPDLENYELVQTPYGPVWRPKR